MTIQEAQTLLKEAYPNRSFKISLEVWYWNHYTPPHTEVEWSVSIVDEPGHYQGRTLETVVNLVTSRQEPLEETEKVAASVEEVA